MRGRLILQYGTRTVAVPRNDGSVLRGQLDLATAYRFISEAYVGYHFHWLHGVNVDAGIFMSYVGLFSYDAFENWSYQPSFTSDNTPWFFNGARIQIFPTDRLKVELWIVNGWQSYGKFNELPGAGVQLRWAPREWINLVFNDYVGTDTQDHPGRVRFHSDNSILVRYYNRPEGRGLSRGALSFTFDLGFEDGDGTSFAKSDFISGTLYSRLWFWRNKIGWTVGGGFVHNPGRYLVLVPTGVAGQIFDASPGTPFDAWDLSTTLDWMPTEQLTVRFEFVHREASIPYFSGPGGVTGPDGYKSGGLSNPDGLIYTNVPQGWTPDQSKQESRIIGAVMLRI
ncbi:MAG: outer membrane beta-barrel protein [Polyangia bacterium]